ncbi:hypothetical protein RSA36_05555 [Pantoea stewartii]|uniref:Secreted protein n=1 Tax=Pantoea stewartii TaxID=66269 RepID=A0AB34VK68_9GAMM|nr:hypothetical protein RSA30_06265 [Pantoea stewartii]KTT00943.1 hypothetical protein RSA13_00510 [Pantoea stewartii]KTT08461.1 hypothetical protein RSA36_05555 [Pantoea stewartii]
MALWRQVLIFWLSRWTAIHHNEKSTTAFLLPHPGVWYCNGCEIVFCMPALFSLCAGPILQLQARVYF